MSVEVLRLRRGTSEQNSRAIEHKVRTLMTSFTELDLNYEVERSSRTNIVLVPTFDEPMADFDADFELLKEQLTNDPMIMMHVSLSTILNMSDSDSSSDDDAGSDIDQHIQSRDWAYTSDGDFVPGQADRSTPQPAAAYQHGRDTGNTTAIFGRSGTTAVTQRRPAQGQFSVAPFQINYDASSDDDSHDGDRSATGGVGGPGSGDDSDDSDDSDGTYFYHSDDSDDTSLDDSDSDDTSLDDSDDSDDSDGDSDDSFADAQSSAFNRAVGNAEMRTVAGEPETTE